jgi:hypothetical protein
MEQFKEGETVHVITKWQDPGGTVNPRGETAVILALVCAVAADGKSVAMDHNSKMYTLPLTEGFVFRDAKEALAQAELYASQYFQADVPDPFADQPIPE